MVLGKTHDLRNPQMCLRWLAPSIQVTLHCAFPATQPKASPLYGVELQDFLSHQSVRVTTGRSCLFRLLRNGNVDGTLPSGVWLQTPRLSNKTTHCGPLTTADLGKDQKSKLERHSQPFSENSSKPSSDLFICDLQTNPPVIGFFPIISRTFLAYGAPAQQVASFQKPHDLPPLETWGFHPWYLGKNIPRDRRGTP